MDIPPLEVTFLQTGFTYSTDNIHDPRLDAICCPHPQTWRCLEYHLSSQYLNSSEELRDDIMQLLLAHEKEFWENYPISCTVIESLHCAMTVFSVSPMNIRTENKIS